MKRVLNSRPLGQAAALSEALMAAGFVAVEIPLLEIAAIPESANHIATLNPEQFNGLFFSSPNGIEYFAKALSIQEKAGWFSKPIYLIGKQSLPKLHPLGATPSFIPQIASLEGFLQEIQVKKPEHWLHPCSFITKLSPATFAPKGIVIQNLPVYAPLCPPQAAEQLQANWEDLEAILFCSGSAVEHFSMSVPKLAASLKNQSHKTIISIGPSTSKTLNQLGYTHFREAKSADNAGLVAALNF